MGRLSRNPVGGRKSLCLRQSLKLDPRSSEAFYGRTIAKEKLKDYDSATADALAAVRECRAPQDNTCCWCVARFCQPCPMGKPSLYSCKANTPRRQPPTRNCCAARLSSTKRTSPWACAMPRCHSSASPRKPSESTWRCSRCPLTDMPHSAWCFCRPAAPAREGRIGRPRD
jgi:hypothetical protein